MYGREKEREQCRAVSVLEKIRFKIKSSNGGGKGTHNTGRNEKKRMCKMKRVKWKIAREWTQQTQKFYFPFLSFSFKPGHLSSICRWIFSGKIKCRRGNIGHLNNHIKLTDPKFWSTFLVPLWVVLLWFKIVYISLIEIFFCASDIEIKRKLFWFAKMYIMPSSCFSSNTKPLPSPIKPKVPDHDGIFEKFIIDNPFIFRVCCFCISRRRKRVDTAKVNGNGHNDIHERNSDDTVLTIDQIEFTRSTIDLNEKWVD